MKAGGVTAGSCADCGAPLPNDSRFCPSCGAPARDERSTEPVDPTVNGAATVTPPVQDVGSEFAGYRIESPIARGGMGVVYRAHHDRLDRPVALKLLAPELSHDERFRERFIAESRSAAAIDHPSILPLYEAGEEDGLLFIATRLVEGEDLKSLVRVEGRLEPRRALGLVEQVGAALDAAHDAGLVHRDVKPANVLIDRSAARGGREHCYLTDFGLTKRIGSESGVTGTGQFVGTADYVAPEQIQGGPLDGRTDLYALGCLLYECLTGEVPFPRDEALATLWAHVNEERPRLTALRPELPGALDDVIAMAMARDAEERFSTSGAFVAAAKAALDGRAAAFPTTPPAPARLKLDAAALQLAAAPPAPPRQPPPRPQPEPEPPGGREPGASRMRRIVAIVAILAAALVATALVAGAALLRDASRDEGKDQARRALETADDTRSLRSQVGELSQRIAPPSASGAPVTPRPQPRLAGQLDDRADRALVLARQARSDEREASAELHGVYVRLERANRRLHRIAARLARVASRPGDDARTRVAAQEDDAAAVDDDIRAALEALVPALPKADRARARRTAARTPRANVKLPDGAAIEITGATQPFASRVSSAGDVNGDDAADVIVAATPGYGESGEAAVVLGSKDRGLVRLPGLGEKGLTIAPGERSIAQLSGAGDANGDGLDDIAVATTPLKSTGGKWTVYVIFGSRGVRDVDLDDPGLEGFQIAGGGEEGFRDIKSMSGVGDVNGDRRDDLAIGGSTYTVGQAMTAVVFGREAGTVDVRSKGSWGFLVDGATGWSAEVGGGGDVNGDGLDDVAVSAGYGARMGFAPPGIAQVIFGRGATSTVELGDLGPDEGITIKDVDAPVTSIDIGPSVNGDDRADVILGAPGPFDGRSTALVVFGGGGGTVNAKDLGGRGYRLESQDTAGCGSDSICGDDFGASVDGVEDVNGDGRGDVVVGAPGTGGPSGRAYVVYGRSSGETVPMSDDLGTRGFVILSDAVDGASDATTPGAGADVAGLGDMDGDGLSEIAVAAPQASAAFVVSSRVDSGTPSGSPSKNLVISADGLGPLTVNRASEEDVRRVLGDPDRTEDAQLAPGSPRARLLAYGCGSGCSTTVYLDDQGIFAGVVTSDPRVRTSSGTRVGTSAGQAARNEGSDPKLADCGVEAIIPAKDRDDGSLEIGIASGEVGSFTITSETTKAVITC